jgi:hypothetical protein
VIVALLFLHGLLRWIVLAAGVNAAIRAFRAPEYGAADARAGLVFVAALDAQVFVGLGLYTLFSPTTRAAFANLAPAMGQLAIRFFVIEHAVAMSLALVAAHIGRVLVRRAHEPRTKQRLTRGWTVAALVVLLVGMPWPGLPYGRPLLPHF